MACSPAKLGEASIPFFSSRGYWERRGHGRILFFFFFFFFFGVFGFFFFCFSSFTRTGSRGHSFFFFLLADWPLAESLWGNLTLFFFPLVLGKACAPIGHLSIVHFERSSLFFPALKEAWGAIRPLPSPFTRKSCERGHNVFFPKQPVSLRSDRVGAFPPFLVLCLITIGSLDFFLLLSIFPY